MPSIAFVPRLCALFLATATFATAQQAAPPAQTPHRNVIIFVADGLRRGSVTPEDMPTFAMLRAKGVDFRNSHSVFPTFTTANASVIATGHALGDTGDFSNVIYPGVLNTQLNTPDSTGSITPFLEADDVLADLNSYYGGNYLGEQTLLSAARGAGFSVASIGKVGPVAIQQADVVGRDETGHMRDTDAIVIDDATGHANSVPLPVSLYEAFNKAGLQRDAPTRTNGYADASQGSNGFSGDAIVPGTRHPNLTQQQWFADVTTEILLPHFAEANKPFVLLFWSRDPDGTQHNQGDSLQTLAPGINGDTTRQALRNVDHNLKQLLNWLEQHPTIKANTDVFVTSDHGFATISRRELDRENTQTAEPSSTLAYDPIGAEKPEPAQTLPTGFLAIDLALWSHTRLFDPAIRATTGDSVYAEVALTGEKSHHPLTGSALLGERISKLDGSDARLIVASNGGSDLLYVPSHDAQIVHETIDTLAGLDYVGGIFVDDAFCPSPTDCPGALPLSAIALKGATKLPTPAIVVTYKVFNRIPGDLQTAIQISDTSLQEGQGMHGGFGRDSTWNNMAAIGPDFKHGFVDATAVGNIDIAPTIASILGIDMASIGSLKGRILKEALNSGPKADDSPRKTLVSAPTANGHRTVLEYQENSGVRYYDRACMTPDDKSTPACPE
jgi:arylsulfatase A-like enzyme